MNVLPYLFFEGRAEEAIEYLEKAGKMAVARSANTDAVTHFSRALGAARRAQETSSHRKVSIEFAKPRA